MMYGYGYGHMGAYGLGFGLGWLLTIVFWVAVVWLVVSLVRHHGISGQGDMKKGDSAMDILRERYAKGEITKEDFERMKKDLQ